MAGAGFNGAHRESARDPRPLDPGGLVSLDIEMHFTSWVFPKGHRIRLAISNAQWPMIWPTPFAMTTSLYLGGADPTRLLLPVVPAAPRPTPAFLLPSDEQATLPGFEPLDAEERNTEKITHEADDRHPETTSVRGEYSTTLSLKDQTLTWESEVEMRSDRENFYFSSVRRLLRNGVLLREKTWKDTIPRDHQ